ncbi:GNAT family N-acetyltransferase [Massilia sp. CCM 8734]|uniref:GNAT family N-acetyltransferase n=1 Tax=Massilia sp. CCM 8734 TaxID=2609283 RepID=UPI00141FB453|nr:GNAT family N-acetyltransferase [Massilia sp. CCM 8734]NHZ98217.1 GNAT family N-acetyltransferase [Massilia sp. CCM 8734]
MKILDTARLVLRTVEAADAPFYLELVNDPDFLLHIGDRGIRTLDAARAHIDNGPVRMQAVLGHAIWLVAHKESGAPIGMCGLIKRDTLPEVDLGYAFLPAWRGQGYAVEAARAVVGYARERLGLARLLAITSPHNTASGALLEKLGLRFDKIVHLTPEDPGTRLYAMQLCATA